MSHVSRRNAVWQESFGRFDLTAGHLALSAADASQFPCDFEPRACPLNGLLAVQFRQTRKATHAALWRAMFFKCLGKVRDRRHRTTTVPCQWFESRHRSHRTVEYNLSRPRHADACVPCQHPFYESLLQYLPPLGWEHINLTGDYV